MKRTFVMLSLAAVLLTAAACAPSTGGHYWFPGDNFYHSYSPPSSYWVGGHVGPDGRWVEGHREQWNGGSYDYNGNRAPREQTQAQPQE